MTQFTLLDANFWPLHGKETKKRNKKRGKLNKEEKVDGEEGNLNKKKQTNIK